MQINILEAKNRLSSLIVAAELDEEVIIARNGQPVAKIVNTAHPKLPRLVPGKERLNILPIEMQPKPMRKSSTCSLAMTMRLLLDTCIVYDWLQGEIKDIPAIQRIQSEGALVSSLSVWEMVIKNALGKMPLSSIAIAQDIEAQGFQ